MYLLWGPGIEPDKTRSREGAPGLRAVASSVLALLGLPPGEAMSHELLSGVSAPPLQPIDYRQFYQAVGAAEETSNAAGEEELAELRALGYVGGGEAASRPAGVERSPLTAGWYNNKALILREQKQMGASREAFEKALELDPNLASALWNLSDMLYGADELDRSDELLLRAFAHGLPHGTEYLIGRAIGYQRAGQTERSLRLVEGAAIGGSGDPQIWLFLGRYRTEAGDCAGAVAAFEHALAIEPDQAPAWASIGIARICLGDRRGAAAAFERSLAIDPDQPRLRQMLAAPPG
jgi:tetratricopeptide (TPR) repeat protein